jgi:hypothetical protein
MSERTELNGSSIQHQYLYVYKLYTTYFLSFVQIALKSSLKLTNNKFTLSPSGTLVTVLSIKFLKSDIWVEF